MTIMPVWQVKEFKRREKAARVSEEQWPRGAAGRKGQSAAHAGSRGTLLAGG